MTDEVSLWKQRILERKANGQTIIEWCREHNVTKGSYHYWRRQVIKAEGSATEHTVNVNADTEPVIFNYKSISETSREAVKNSVSMEVKDFLERIRYVLFSCRFYEFSVVVYLSIYSITTFWFFIPPDWIFLHQNKGILSIVFCGLCPHPASGIRLGFPGNTFNADGIRSGWLIVLLTSHPGFFFL